MGYLLIAVAVWAVLYVLARIEHAWTFSRPDVRRMTENFERKHGGHDYD